MQRTAVLEGVTEVTTPEAENFHIVLSQDEVELVRSGLGTLLLIFTRHEHCNGRIRDLLAKLPLPRPSPN